MSHDLRPGSEPVPGYTLVGRLGKGGFGEVWKATGPGGFEVALKFVTLEDRVGKVELRALEVIKSIRHPNLLANFGSWQEDGQLIIAMELADRTLLDRLHELEDQGVAGIPAPEIFEYFLEAAKGLDFLNEPRHPTGEGGTQGIQHRDVKPPNLLLVGGSVKVADFGLARVMEHSKTGGHSQSMTVSYAPPEAFGGKMSRQSDQYALAITYCQLRGGRLPFRGGLEAVMLGHLQLPPDLSMIPEVERPAVARALSKTPGDRWPSCRAFVQAVMAAEGMSVPDTVLPADPAWKGPNVMAADGRESESVIDLDFPISEVPTQPDTATGGAPTKPDPLSELAHEAVPKRWVDKLAPWILAAAVLLIAILLLLPRGKPADGVAFTTPGAGSPDSKGQGLAGPFAVETTKVAPAIATNPPAAGQDKASAPLAPSNKPRESPSSHASESAFVPLFNGKNLSGWRMTGSQDHIWKVTAGGVLEGSGHSFQSRLVTERSDFSNFHLLIETKLAEGPNSGIIFPFTDDDMEETVNYMANIAGTNQEVGDSGALTIADRGSAPVSLAKADPVIPIKPGEWFTEEVIADGNIITILIKGVVVAKFRLFNRKSTSGAIGFLCRGGSKVAFRKIEIKKQTSASATSLAESGGESGTVQQPPDFSRVAWRTGGRDFWQVDGDQLVWTEDSRPARIYFGSRTWANYSFSADVKLHQDATAVYLCFRQRQGGEYFFRASKEGSSICHWVDQQSASLNERKSREAQIANGRWQSMRIEVRGEKFVAYLNGQLVCEASDQRLSRGDVGFRVDSNSPCRFRNIRVTAPNGKILWEGLPELPTASLYGVSLKGSR